jgi:hypothetical protein
MRMFTVLLRDFRKSSRRSCVFHSETCNRPEELFDCHGSSRQYGVEMKVWAANLSILQLLIVAPAQAAPDPPIRTTISFDRDWRFLKADAPGAEKPSFEDATWRTLDVPHDWSIEGPFDQKSPAGGAGAFLPAGVGWYRKHFTLPVEYAHRRVFIEFDGVMANSAVWLNGIPLGKRPYGYVSFQYEMTGFLTFGEKNPNVLSVRADNSGQPASRWYAGAGIYRHVRLVAANAVHLEHGSTFVTTPAVTRAEATVSIRSAILNQSDAAHTVALEVSLLDPDGKTVATATTAPQTRGCRQVRRFQAGSCGESSAALGPGDPSAVPRGGEGGGGQDRAGRRDRSLRRSGIPLRCRYRLLAQRPESQNQRRGPAP